MAELPQRAKRSRLDGGRSFNASPRLFANLLPLGSKTSRERATAAGGGAEIKSSTGVVSPVVTTAAAAGNGSAAVVPNGSARARPAMGSVQGSPHPGSNGQRMRGRGDHTYQTTAKQSDLEVKVSSAAANTAAALVGGATNCREINIDFSNNEMLDLDPLQISEASARRVKI